MKKALSLILVLVMLFSLCACGNSGSQNTDPSSASQAVTDSIEKVTDEPTAGSTEAPTAVPIIAPTQAPTEAPTAAPTVAPTIAPTECAHTYEDATCTTPKTCSKCGATEGSTAGHSWSDATCTAPKTCSKCGISEGDAAGHSWSDATCTTPKTCTVCNTTEGAVADHDFYAGECKNCKTPDDSMVRIYSDDKSFSFVLPRAWSSYWIENLHTNDGTHILFVTSTKYTDMMIMLNVFTFYVSEGSVYTEKVSEEYLSDPVSAQENSEGATEADWEQLKQVVAMYDEIVASFRWE